MPCRAILRQGMSDQVMQKQNSFHQRGREFFWHLMHVFYCLEERDSVPSSAWGGLCLFPASSKIALMITLEQATGSKGFPNSNQAVAPFISSDEPNRLAGTNILPCRSNFFTKKFSHFPFSAHSEFQVLVLKDISPSSCTWES